ncbi:FlxA-like family protein [Brevibacillus borstelensis]|uniref:FlxA-like family protein n=1 Tax=Brevibacillus borstelensis TaxID=45462 RepID=UPI0030BB04AE
MNISPINSHTSLSSKGTGNVMKNLLAKKKALLEEIQKVSKREDMTEKEKQLVITQLMEQIKQIDKMMTQLQDSENTVQGNKKENFYEVFMDVKKNRTLRDRFANDPVM